MKQLILALALAALSYPATASADEAKKPGKVKKTDKTKKAPERVKTYSFLADEIDGAAIGPDGESFVLRPPSRFTNLIRVRQHYFAEIAKSTDDL